MFSKKDWNEANREKVRLYSLRYRLRKKGMDLPPETLAEFEAMREAKKAATKERDKARKKVWTDENRERIRARYRERLATDPEYRAKELERRRQFRIRNQKVKTPEEHEATLRRKREAAAKAARASKAKAAAQRAIKEAEKQQRITEYKEAPPEKPKQFYRDRKPGRLLALMGWRGF